MSGIVGAWDLGGRPLSAELLSAMLERIKHRGPDGLSVWVEGAAGLGCALRRNTPESGAEVQPFVHPSGSVIVFDGRLDDREELISALRDRPEADALVPDPELVMAAYEVFGESFVERLNGDFALALFDPVKQWLVLARDPIGARPLHFFRSRDTFVFASEVSALLAHPSVDAKPDLGQLARFALEGRPRESDVAATLFEGVHSVVPGNIAIITPGRFVTRRYWDFDGSRQIRFASHEGYQDGFRAQLERAVRRRMRGLGEVYVAGVGAPLDSSVRATASLIRRSDVQVVTSGDSSLAELEVAVAASESPTAGVSDVCRMPRSVDAGVVLWGPPADAIFLDRAFLLDLAGRLAWSELFAYLGSSGAPTETGSYRRFAADFLASRAPSFFAGGRTRRNSPLWFAERFEEQIDKAAEEEKWGNRSATYHSRAVYGFVRSRRAVMELESANKVGARLGMEVAFPFMDRDLLAFLMAIPGEERSRPGAPFAILGLSPDPPVQRPLGTEGLEEALSALAESASCSRFGVTEQAELALEIPPYLLKARSGDQQAVRDLRVLLSTEMWLQNFFS